MSNSIAMWSGPRNISTALMRSFENRSNCFVSDEPFYSYFLHKTGLQHPLRDEIIKSGLINYNEIIKYITGPIPSSKKIWYQKHMAHHILPESDMNWIKNMKNCLLIRHPSDVILSYSKKNEIHSILQLGYVQQSNIYGMLSQEIEAPPIIIDAQDLLQEPRKMLIKICENLEAKFDEKMLSWPSGSRKTDGIWGKHWYKKVEASTGFKSYIKTSRIIPSKYQ
ncbi:MAG: HAD family hydrolase, partial [SAR202 cluster bacterium]|nr:HAD family hydrolase [SAR202 cluster bacterium]